MAATTGVYVERYAWSRRTTSIVVGGAVLISAAIGLQREWLPTIALFAAGGLVLLWGAAQYRVALRVDARGVTLGGSPPHYRATTAVVPWTDIVSVMLWRQVLPTGALMPYLGLERRPGAAALPAASPRHTRPVHPQSRGPHSDSPGPHPESPGPRPRSRGPHPDSQGPRLPDGLAPDIPLDVLMASRAVDGWRLDRRALARAVAGFAPDVRVLDADTGLQITPETG
jgi:hypothetical protein